MPCYGCTTSRFGDISRAMAKSASARLRRMGILPTTVDWSARAAICERCPLRVIHKGVSYCGKPFLQLIDRTPSLDGCGCPTRDKAQSPDEHCPLDTRHQPAMNATGECNCKWCNVGLG